MALNFPKFAKVIYVHRNLSSDDPMPWIFNFVLRLKTDYSKWSNLIYTWCPLFGNGHEMLWILQFFLLLSFIVNFINSSSEHCFSNCLFNSKLIHIRNIYIFFFFKIGWFWNYFCKGFLKPENSRSCNVKFLSSYRQVYVTFWKFKRKSDSF